MRKSIIILLVLLLMLVPMLTSAICCERNTEICTITETCQDADCGDCIITIYNRDGSVKMPESDMTMVSPTIYIFNTTNLTDYGSYPYVINCTTEEGCQGDCQVELKQECEVQEMEGLAVMLFVMLITAMFFILPLKIRFSKSELADYILKKCSIIMGLFFLSLNTAIMATIADSGGLDILQELFRYLWFINWTIYISMMVLIWGTVTGTIKLYGEIARKKRMGEEE